MVWELAVDAVSGHNTVNGCDGKLNKAVSFDARHRASPAFLINLPPIIKTIHDELSKLVTGKRI